MKNDAILELDDKTGVIFIYDSAEFHSKGRKESLIGWIDFMKKEIHLTERAGLEWWQILGSILQRIDEICGAYLKIIFETKISY